MEVLIAVAFGLGAVDGAPMLCLRLSSGSLHLAEGLGGSVRSGRWSGATGGFLPVMKAAAESCQDGHAVRFPLQPGSVLSEVTHGGTSTQPGTVGLIPAAGRASGSPGNGPDTRLAISRQGRRAPAGAGAADD